MSGLTQVEAVLSITTLSTISPKVNMVTVAMLSSDYYVTINFHLADFYINITFNPSVTMACTKMVPPSAPPILVGKGIAAYPICM